MQRVIAVLSSVHTATLLLLASPEVWTVMDLNDGQQHEIYYRLGARS